MNNITEQAIRQNLYNFIGSVLVSSSDGEAAMALICEELTKLMATDDDLKQFDKSLIKPMIKATHYILTQQYNKLLTDTQKTFDKNVPIPVQAKLDNDKKLIALLDLYIKQL